MGSALTNSLFFLIIFGFFLPFLVEPFLDTSFVVSSSSPLTSSVVGFVANGFTVFGFTVNPASWFGSSFHSYLVSVFSTFFYLPDLLAVLLIVCWGVLFVIGLLALARGVSS